METSASEKCRKCGKSVGEGCVRGEGTGEPTALCAECLESAYPAGKGLPVVMDMDGNLYFIDKARNCMVIFFAYGDAPYSACTEVGLEEEDECGCGFALY